MNDFTKAEADLVDEIVSRTNVAKDYFLEYPAINDFIEYRANLAAEIADINVKAVIELVKERLNAY